MPCNCNHNLHKWPKHGHVKQLFSTQTQIQSLSRMARCACMVVRHKQPCTSVSRDDKYQTSQECPSNKHCTLDLRRKSPEAVTPPRTQLQGRPSSSSDLKPLVQLVANVPTRSTVPQETVRFMDVVEHFSEHVTDPPQNASGCTHHSFLQNSSGCTHHSFPFSTDQNKIPRRQHYFHVRT